MACLQHLFLLAWLWTCSATTAFLSGEGRNLWPVVLPRGPSLAASTTSSSFEPSSPIPSPTSTRRTGTKHPNEVRGDNRYGSENNSTIPSPQEVADAVGVKPTNPKATAKTWQRAWRLHKRMLPVLHAFDRNKPPDSSLSLAVLWWKALSGNDASSPASDGGLSYDLLPRATRKIVSRTVRQFYPRLHHANVEIRTAYLDRAITKVVDTARKSDASTRIRLILLGGGYDVRSIKLKERGLIDEAVELDLPQVVEAKHRLLTNRLLKRRRKMTEADLPDMMPIDLNKIDDVRRSLDEIVTQGNESEWKQWHNIFVFEGVMIYLDEGIPSELLRLCSNVLHSKDLSGSLCFADRLENIPEGYLSDAITELTSNGWELNEWLPKPGLARHMGQASLLSTLEKQ